MKISFIEVSKLADLTISTLLQDPRLYHKVENGTIYIPPPTPKVKTAFMAMMSKFLHDLTNKDTEVYIVKSCKMADNWRLKHVGKRYINMVKTGSIVSKPNIDLGQGWEEIFNEWFSKQTNKKIEIDNVDVIDMYAIISVLRKFATTQYHKDEAKCLYDGNCDIDHLPAIPKFVVSLVNDLFTAKSMV